jgi:hypothetical protein
MILPYGFRRLCLNQAPAKTALIPNSVASAREHGGRIFRLEGRRTLCLPAFAHNKSGYCKRASPL